MATNIGVLIVEKAGTLKPLCVKIYNETELYKRCGFKSNTNFHKRYDWCVTRDDKCYTIAAYGKDAGRIGFENNYSFPPPLNTISLFGNCVLVLYVEDNSSPGTSIVESLTVDFWNSLTTEMVTINPDDNIYSVPKVSNTNGYLNNELETDNITVLNDNTISSDDDSNISELVEEEYLIE